PGSRPDGPERAGQLGEDGPRRRHRGAAVGRERPGRDAHGGVDQPDGRLLPRDDAHRRRSRERGAGGGPSGGTTRHSVSRSASLLTVSTGRGGVLAKYT